jgi:hypothetical protein
MFTEEFRMRRKIIALSLAMLLCAAPAGPALAETVPKPSEDDIKYAQSTGQPLNPFYDSVDIGAIISQGYFYEGSGSPTFYVAAPATVTVRAPAVGGISKGKVVEYSPGIFVFDYDFDGNEPMSVSPAQGSWVDLHPDAESVDDYGSDPLPHWSVGTVFSLPEGVYAIGNNDVGHREFYLVAGNPPEANMDSSRTAKPTASTVLVNGENVSFDAYNIDGNNYFKLRDIAYVLSGTAKQFEVGWDAQSNSITLARGAAYTPAGGEMQGKGSGEKTATPGSSLVWIDESNVSDTDTPIHGPTAMRTAYAIEGNNYFKLREIGQEFNFGVDWDGARNTIVIDTGKGYTPEGTSAGGNNFDEIAAQKPQTFVYDRPAYGIKFDAPDYYGDVVCGESFYFDSEPVIDFDGEPAAFKRDSGEYTFSVFVTDAPSLTMNTYFYKSGEMHIQTAKGTAAGNTVKLELTRLPDGRHNADASTSYQIPRGLSGVFAKFDADDGGWGGLYGGCIIMSKA